MKHISIKECYDTLEITDTNSEMSITNKEADELYKFIVKNKLDEDNIIWQRRGVTFINYVGYIKLPTFSIEILPKIDINKNDLEQSRRMLLNMLQKSGLIKVDYSELSLLHNYKQNLGEILAFLFAKKLQNELIKGPYLQYITMEENINLLKGKLILTEHIKNIATNKDKVYCAFEEFCIDNNLNQILKHCVVNLIKSIRNPETIKLLKHCIVQFAYVSDREIYPYELEKFSFNRLNNRYASVFILAKMLLSGYSSTGSTGNDKSYSILFKMEEIFERYIGNLIARNIKDSVVYTQHSKYKLMIKEGKDTGIFQLKPDIVIEYEGKQTLILDTKWKRIISRSSRYGIKRNDIYQMYVYLTRYQDVKNVILLYPHNENIAKEAGEMLESWHLEDCIRKKIRVYSVSLSDEDQAIRCLKKIITYNR
ncbi:McrC family protein [Clostridium tyrobutyricum]|uniref:McrC family protein n=1 Tax=Clostridium tyrobutyricum TaxID=1519 RepID=UPI001C3D533E|nr:McrC family protein [Clostridium tyrobutyricum]MBV4438634.1 McrC family protein [Clostridium tyrobutyricum]